MHWIHHILFDPLSEWEKFVVTIDLLPVWVVLYLVWALWPARKKQR